MIGDDVKDIDYNESGLTTFLKAINSRFYPLDVSRGTPQDEYTKGDRKYKTIKVDKYPLLDDTHPTVIENGRYYQFDVDVTDLEEDDGGPGPVDPTETIKLIMVPFHNTSVNFQFTVAGEVSPEFSNLFDGSAAAWAEQRMMIISPVPIGLLPDYSLLIIGSLHTTAKPVVKVNNLTSYDFTFDSTVQAGIDQMLPALLSGIPNLHAEQIKLFTSGEFKGEYTHELTYINAVDEENPGMGCANATDELSVTGLVDESASIPVTDYLIADFTNNTFISGMTSTPAQLLAAGYVTENIVDPDDGSRVGFRVRNVRNVNRSLGLTFMPVNQNLLKDIRAIGNPAVVYDAEDNYYKGCVLPYEDMSTGCPATANQFDWYRISGINNIDLWYNDANMGPLTDYLNGNLSHDRFIVNKGEGSGGSIVSNYLDCLKFMFVDRTGVWNPRDTEQFQAYLNDEDNGLIYGDHGITFYLAARTPQPVEFYFQLLDTNGWALDSAIGGRPVQVAISYSGDFVATAEQPDVDRLILNVAGQEVEIASAPGSIGGSRFVYITAAPNNTNPDMNHITWDIPVSTNYTSNSVIGSSTFNVLTELLNPDAVPVLGIGENYPVLSMEKDAGARAWNAGGRIVTVRQKTVIQMDESYAGQTLTMDVTNLASSNILGTFDETGRIEFLAPYIAVDTDNANVNKVLYIRDSSGVINAQFTNLQFEVARPILQKVSDSSELTGWVTTVNQPFPQVKFALPGIVDSSAHQVTIVRESTAPEARWPVLAPSGNVVTTAIADGFWTIDSMATPTLTLAPALFILRISIVYEGRQLWYRTTNLTLRVDE